ncbi:MAG: hypothetical protein Q4A90_00600 [Streptococcus sp.]|nr:hypothetical protein [Streptococcus sp.]
MSKLLNISYSLLQKLMLILMLHWLIAAIFYGFSLSIISFPIIAILLFYIVYRYQPIVKKLYHYLMRKKWLIMLVVVIFQIIILVSAELLIRRDAAVVFMGAFKELKESSISNYLTRNPNNIPLFLYERFFFNLFGSRALWVLQALNIFYADITAFILYRGCLRYFSKNTADLTFSFYILLFAFSPFFISTYTDVLSLPFVSLQIFIILSFFKKEMTTLSIAKNSILLGLLTSVVYLLRPPVLILFVAFFAILLMKKAWKKFFLIATVFGLSFIVSFSVLNYGVKHQTEVPIAQGEGLAKGPLVFINLGLTHNGHNQEDMKEGLLEYIEPSKREDYNSGLFKQENVIKEIKRRLNDYTLISFLEHSLYKETLTVMEGNLGWLYRSVENEKTPYVSPLYESTKNNWFAQFIRDYFLDTDKKEFGYYALAKQVIWIVMALGLVSALWKYRTDDALCFFSLAVFGGLLFLQIFEGGKTRYLIQFLPQILILSSLGLTTYRPQFEIKTPLKKFLK